MESDPNVGHHGCAEEDAADEEASDGGEPRCVMCERGGPREQDGIEVESEGEVEQREDEHEVHGVADPDDDTDHF